jgi:hypothetical protein
MSEEFECLCDEDLQYIIRSVRDCRCESEAISDYFLTTADQFKRLLRKPPVERERFRIEKLAGVKSGIIEALPTVIRELIKLSDVYDREAREAGIELEKLVNEAARRRLIQQNMEGEE